MTEDRGPTQEEPIADLLETLGKDIAEALREIDVTLHTQLNAINLNLWELACDSKR